MKGDSKIQKNIVLDDSGYVTNRVCYIFIKEEIPFLPLFATIYLFII